MENPKFVHQLYDAVDLIKMLEHIADGQQSTTPRHTEVPWSGIRLTLAQTRDLVLAALDDYEVEGEVPITPRANRGKKGGRDVESIVNSNVEYSNDQSRSGVRELMDNGSTGTFNRIQLPRENSASGEVL